MSGERKRRRPLGPLDDYCDELEEEIDQARALLERCDDEFYFDEFDDPAQLQLQDDVKAFLSRIRAEATAERCQRCNGAGMRPCECGCGPMPCECRARHRSAPVTADVCGKKCDHGSTTPRAELTGEERAVLEAVEEAKRRLLVMIESLEADEDGTTDNDLLLVDLDGIRNVLARRAARKESKP